MWDIKEQKMISDNELRRLADRYETELFLEGDPSWFMHQVSGRDNQETMAFLAQALSYGSRQQFLRKIQLFLDWSGGEVYAYMRDGLFERDIRDDNSCFYRLYSNRTMLRFCRCYERLIREYQSLEGLIRQSLCRDNGKTTALEAIALICRFFSQEKEQKVIPKDTSSSCKRLCMFMRWMVRCGSPVDLGLWSGLIDRESLIIPLDTHVLHEAQRVGLSSSLTASMSSALRLTDKLRSAFPGDPVRGDYALFGMGVEADKV